MIQLHVVRCELTYEGAFVKPRFSLVDSPGKLCDLLLEALEAFGSTGADLIQEDAEPGERGVACEIDDLGARVTLYGDRAEIRCASFKKAAAAQIASVLAKVWPGLEALETGAAPKTHSFLFEAETATGGISYQELLNRLAPVPGALPGGTETAVVYYLPRDTGGGYGESSLVLNRSAEVDGGVQVNATLVYEAESIKPAAALSAAQDRLDGLLQNLGLEWIED